MINLGNVIIAQIILKSHNMFKIDIHTHMIPESINIITKYFTDKRFITCKKISKRESILYSNNKQFRTIKCNCWDSKVRINEMINTDKTVIADIWVSKEENCFPMIQSGSAHNEMVLSKDQKQDESSAEKGKILV